ncbi:MAG: TIGR04222 domain-containing membrane protein [Planctomycetes bacterium]|nr:TIGR04222 domain-containing membrane protein [Planctomycetota bacterium]
MTPAQAELWQRLQSFEFDEPGSVLTFARRLARENRWSLCFARRVIEEYKRYCLLAVSLPRVAAPSEQVDQAWHLHLTYTQNYWGRFCRDALQTKLHHHPTRGGPAENDKHFAMYEQTLADYREVFGAPAPADIWPPAHVRFGADLHAERVNRGEYWLVPKPRWLRSLRQNALVPAAAVLGSGVLVAAFASPFDLTGPQFLALYIVLLVALTAFCVYWRYSYRMPKTLEHNRELSPYELALLNGGPRAILATALAALVHRNAVTTGDPADKATARKFKPGGNHDTSRDPIEATVQQSVIRHGEADAKQLWQDLEPSVEPISQRLEDDGLLVRSGNISMGRWIPVVLFLGLIAFGVTKCFVGLDHHKPIGFLVMLLALTIGLLLAFCSFNRRTVAGEKLLDERRKEREDLKHSTTGGSPNLATPDLAMAVALFGVAVLPTTMFGSLHTALGVDPRKGMWGTGGGCGSGAASGCGGGGCGGGGCGGGGCGGCGGGGD